MNETVDDFEIIGREIIGFCRQKEFEPIKVFKVAGGLWGSLLLSLSKGYPGNEDEVKEIINDQIRQMKSFIEELEK